MHTPANLVWCPTPDGQVVGADLSCRPADMPVLFGHLAPTEQYDEVDAQASDTVQHAWTEFPAPVYLATPTEHHGRPAPPQTPLLTVIDDASDSRPLDISPVAELINSMRTDADEVVCQTLTPKSRAMPARPEA